MRAGTPALEVDRVEDDARFDSEPLEGRARAGGQRHGLDAQTSDRPQSERTNRMSAPRQLGSVDMCDHAAAGCARERHEQEIAQHSCRCIRDADMNQVRCRAQPEDESGEKASLPQHRFHLDTTS